MRLLVYGCGAIGSAVGGLLADAGERVTLVGREAHMRAIDREGLFIGGIWGEHHVAVDQVATGFDSLATGEFDAVLLTVRAYDTPAAGRELAAFLPAATPVVSLQNGLGNCEALADVLGGDRVIGGRVIFGARLPAAGRVEITVYAEEVLLGAWTQGAGDTVRLAEALAERFSRAAIPTRAVDDVRPYLWAKVLYNGALNPLSALLNCRYGDLAENEATRALMTETIDEIYQVAAAVGQALPQPTCEGYLRHFYGKQVPATALHRSSMLQAIEQGKRTEIDAMNGYVVERAKALGLETPVNRLLVRLIHAKEALAASG